MSYMFADSLRAGSGRNWFRPDPAEKLVYLVGFIIRNYLNLLTHKFASLLKVTSDDYLIGQKLMWANN